ncbi:glutamine amidotransferase [Desulfolithobacter dissulfuricans]|uniref:Glutamine amidotransferase n=1 Tax=Desulfolithobacter dissulfuricans TaxID=2795293 RepID=A0A915XIJ7_9BACT|nr:type 1 glutamine amidotransferase domain-containing protein [Desulfolithobacter dissulfuricans]BCO09904.1 glutamine amidotransferase [Desulfolithobacter dissulfuricans]
MKVLIISGDMFEDTELLVPWYRLLEENIDVDIASIRAGTITGKHGYKVTAKKSLDEIDPSSYDLLILPGGKAPAKLRENERLLALVRHFFSENKTVAAICHGPQILVSAGVLAGRRVTCYRGMAEELKSGGADYKDQAVVVDGNLITSRVPGDLPVFMREIMKKCRKRD